MPLPAALARRLPTSRAGRSALAVVVAAAVATAGTLAWAAFTDRADISARTTATAPATLACSVAGVDQVWVVAAVRTADDDWTNTVSGLDAATGALTTLVAVALPHPLTSLSFDESSQVLYALDGHDGRVYVIDANGTVTDVGTSDAGVGEWSGTWTAAGIATIDRAKDLLVVHDPATGDAVGDPVLLDQRPLDGDLAELGGVLYGIVSADAGDRLATVPTTGTPDATGDHVASPTLLTPPGSGIDVTGLWAADGVLWAIGHDGTQVNAYTLDTASGAFTLVHAGLGAGPVLDAASCTA